MKKLLLRLRHWLIKKLGGYCTEQSVTIRRGDFLNQHRFHPATLRAEVRIIQPWTLHELELEECIGEAIRRAKERLARGIMEQDCVAVHRKDDIETGDIVVAVRLCIIPPEDAAAIGL